MNSSSKSSRNQKISFFSTKPPLKSDLSFNPKEIIIDLGEEVVDPEKKNFPTYSLVSKPPKGMKSLILPQCIEIQSKMMDYSVENNEPTEWPDHPFASYLTTLEQELVCPICSEFFNNPHTLLCGHSFCSLCIRRHLDASINQISSDTCPCCREKAEAFDLRVNINLIRTINSYKKIRFGIFDLLNFTTKDQVEIQHFPYFQNKDSKDHNLESPSSKANASGARIKQKLSFMSTHDLSKEKIISILDKLSEESQVKFINIEKFDKKKLEIFLKNFIHLVNSQINSLKPLTLDQVIASINVNERNLMNEKKKEDLTKKNFFNLKTNFDQEQRKKLYKLAKESMKKAKLKNIENNFEENKVENQEILSNKDDFLSSSQNLSQFFSQNLSQYMSQPLDDHNETNNLNSDNNLSQINNLKCIVSSLKEQDSDDKSRNGDFKMYLDSLSWIFSLNENDFGDWRVVMSEKIRKLFFFNSKTSIGQFFPPTSLLKHTSIKEKDLFLKLHFNNDLDEYHKYLLEEERSSDQEKIISGVLNGIIEKVLLNENNLIENIDSLIPQNTIEITSQELLDNISLSQVNGTESFPLIQIQTESEELKKFDIEIQSEVINDIKNENEFQLISDAQSEPNLENQTSMPFNEVPSKVFFNLEQSQTEYSPLLDNLNSEIQEFDFISKSCNSPPDSPIPLSLSNSPPIQVNKSKSNNLFLFTQLPTQVPNNTSDNEYTQVEQIPESYIPIQINDLHEIDSQSEGAVMKPFNQPWSCQYCTYNNTKLFNKCEMCENLNPDFQLVNNKPRRSLRNFTNSQLSEPTTIKRKSSTSFGRNQPKKKSR